MLSSHCGRGRSRNLSAAFGAAPSSPRAARASGAAAARECAPRRSARPSAAPRRGRSPCGSTRPAACSTRRMPGKVYATSATAAADRRRTARCSRFALKADLRNARGHDRRAGQPVVREGPRPRRTRRPCTTNADHARRRAAARTASMNAARAASLMPRRLAHGPLVADATKR